MAFGDGRVNNTPTAAPVPTWSIASGTVTIFGAEAPPMAISCGTRFGIFFPATAVDTTCVHARATGESSLVQTTMELA